MLAEKQQQQAKHDNGYPVRKPDLMKIERIVHDDNREHGQKKGKTNIVA
jgi:hypothetical protein